MKNAGLLGRQEFLEQFLLRAGDLQMESVDSFGAGEHGDGGSVRMCGGVEWNVEMAG